MVVERRAKKGLGAVAEMSRKSRTDKLHKRMDQEINGEEHRQWKKTIQQRQVELSDTFLFLPTRCDRRNYRGVWHLPISLPTQELPGMLYTVESGVFDSLWYFIICYFAQTAVSLLLYGFYINLFLLSLHTLSRRKTAGTKFLIVASCIMAVLGTTQMALDVATNGSFTNLD
ncbi:hypothetical protein B0H14DRAFT_2565351 [Mycena olivaceomarginata]|nr:hypothetical protein B0H14DRAFT_2565351 [Mycena olivaceomarginata]